MAAHGDTGDQHETMDISEHLRTWRLFTAITKWSLIAIGLLMAFLAIFRTHG